MSIVQTVNHCVDKDYPQDFSRIKSARVLPVVPGQAITLDQDLAARFHCLRDVHPDQYLDPMKWQFDIQIIRPKTELVATFKPGMVLNMGNWVPLLIWPVAIEMDDHAQYVRALFLKFAATDASLAWAVN